MTCMREPVHKNVTISKSMRTRWERKHPSKTDPRRSTLQSQLMDPKRMHLDLPVGVSTGLGRGQEGVLTVGISITSKEIAPKQRVDLKLLESQAKCLLSQQR